MPAYELTEDQVKLLETAQKLGGMTALDNMFKAHQVHNKLYANPKLRTSYEQLIKAEFPTTQTTADLAAPYVERLEQTEKKFNEFLASQAKQKADELQAKRQSDFNSAWAQMVEDHKLTEEGQEAIGKYMQEKGLFDPESAALSYFKHNPKPPEPIQPAGLTPQTWGVGPLPGEDPESGKLLMTEPERWADIEAVNTLNEIRRVAA